jgi:hypothetical protein
LKVSGPREIIDKIAAASARCVCTLYDRVWVNPVDGHVATSVTEYILDISPCPLYVPIDVHRKPWSLGDGEPEIKCDGPRNATQANENAPAVVYVPRLVEVVCNDRIFESSDRRQRD